MPWRKARSSRSVTTLFGRRERRRSTAHEAVQASATYGTTCDSRRQLRRGARVLARCDVEHPADRAHEVILDFAGGIHRGPAAHDACELHVVSDAVADHEEDRALQG